MQLDVYSSNWSLLYRLEGVFQSNIWHMRIGLAPINVLTMERTILTVAAIIEYP